MIYNQTLITNTASKTQYKPTNLNMHQTLRLTTAISGLRTMQNSANNGADNFLASFRQNCQWQIILIYGIVSIQLNHEIERRTEIRNSLYFGTILIANNVFFKLHLVICSEYTWILDLWDLCLVGTSKYCRF